MLENAVYSKGREVLINCAALLHSLLYGVFKNSKKIPTNTIMLELLNCRAWWEFFYYVQQKVKQPYRLSQDDNNSYRISKEKLTLFATSGPLTLFLAYIHFPIKKVPAVAVPKKLGELAKAQSNFEVHTLNVLG